MSKSFRNTLLTSAVLAVSQVSLAQADVTIWAWDPNFNVAIMKEAAERYQAAHPDAAFNIVDFSRDDVEQKLQVGLAAGGAGVLPDIVLIEDYVAQKYLTSFPGAFAPLTDAIDASAFAQYKIGATSEGGEVYGVPFDSGVSGFFYRSDYLAEAGFSAEDLEDITWERFLEIGAAVKDKTGHAMMALDPSDSDFIAMMMQSGGEWYFNDDGSLNITGNEALAAALETFKALVDSDAVASAAGWADWVGKFTTGDVASVTSGAWIVGTVKSAEDQAGNWSVAPTPRLPIDASVNASNRGGSSWYVLETGAEKDTAIDFLNEIYGKDVDFYQQILTERGAVGTLLAAADGPAYQEGDAFFGGAPIWATFSEWMAEVPAVNYGSYTAEVHAAMQSNLPAYLRGRIDVDQMLDAVERQVKGQIQ